MSAGRLCYMLLDGIGLCGTDLCTWGFSAAGTLIGLYRKGESIMAVTVTATMTVMVMVNNTNKHERSLNDLLYHLNHIITIFFESNRQYW